MPSASSFSSFSTRHTGEVRKVNSRMSKNSAAVHDSRIRLRPARARAQAGCPTVSRVHADAEACCGCLPSTRASSRLESASAGFEFVTAYAASKFGLEGWMESLQAEIAPFGIATTIVNPGFFRTELLTEQSTNYAEPSIADYDERRGPLVDYWKSQNGRQSGDPVKLARALMAIAHHTPPPRRFVAGADAIAGAEQKIADLKQQIEANRELSTSLAFD